MQINHVYFLPGWDIPREPGSHNIFAAFHAVLAQIDFKVRISCHLKKFFLSHTCMKYFLVIRRNFLALKLINCQRKKFIVTERNLLSRAEMFCHKKKFLVTGRNFLLVAVIFCHRKNFLAKVKISFCKKKFLVTGRNFLAREGISCHS